MTEYKYHRSFKALARDHDGFGSKEYVESWKELDEVYRKAEAFDEISKVMNYHYPNEEMRETHNTYQNPKVVIREVDNVIKNYESGDE